MVDTTMITSLKKEDIFHILSLFLSLRSTIQRGAVIVTNKETQQNGRSTMRGKSSFKKEKKKTEKKKKYTCRFVSP